MSELSSPPTFDGGVALEADTLRRGPPGGQHKRRTIAFLIDYPDLAGQSYGITLRDAVNASCRELDINLYIVIGRGLEDPTPAGRVHNRVYEWLHPETIDGVILLATSLAAHAGTDAVARLCSKYLPIPICCLGIAVPGVPSVVVDNRLGMRAVVEHLVHDHGCRQPVFIGGPPANPEAALRLATYREVLREANIPVEPAREMNGRFLRGDARVAVESLLNRGVDFDAIVAANDAMALGALTALQQYGKRVPRDVAISGFDDVHEVELVNPPLTTARQPLGDMGRLALQTVLKQITGHSVPLIQQLPTEIVIRKSCGCGSFPARHDHTSSKPSTTQQANLSSEQLQRVACSALKILDDDSPAGAECVHHLLDGLDAELQGQPHAFMDALELLLPGIGTDTRTYQRFQEIITLLREEFRPFVNAEFEDVWHDARCSIMLACTRSQVLLGLATADVYNRAVQTAEHFAAVHRQAFQHVSNLDAYPRAIVKNAFMSRIAVDDPEMLEPWLCIFEGNWFEPPPGRFPLWDLIPGGGYPDGRRHTSFVLPLTCDDQVLGIAVLEFAPHTKGHEILRDQFATALSSHQLHEEVLRTTTLHERSVQERLATARRMESLSVLAGGVAHDLNNALGPLVALPDVILAGLDSAMAGDADVAAGLREDINCIKTAAQRASRTIKDLLTLGRQGKTKKGLVDLNVVVADSLPSNGSHLTHTPTRQVDLISEPNSEPLWVNGSEPHLGRAISNLIRNAIEAIAGPGIVTIKTYSAEIVEPLARFEAIEPGSYAVVRVSDTGSGISDSVIGRVFEPFFSSKKLGEESGSGLGLAIVHGVVKDHGGFVDVESQVGKGTTFFLYFPRAAASSATTSRRSSPIPLRKARILVVDDDLIQLRTSTRLLASLGFAVEACVSGSAACERIASTMVTHHDESRQDVTESSFDLVILDMLLREDRDGLEVLGDIWKLCPQQRAIIASGHAPTERIERALSAGLTWLAKPFSAGELERVVRKALAEPTSDLPRSLSSPAL
jgi:DNA-binding LacI/PurR family transcriptional regulator/signal transduction histidine kinase/FixJ family two-component response regulator